MVFFFRYFLSSCLPNCIFSDHKPLIIKTLRTMCLAWVFLFLKHTSFKMRGGKLSVCLSTALPFTDPWPTRFNQSLSTDFIRNPRRRNELLLAESFVLFNILWSKIIRLNILWHSAYFSLVRASISYLSGHYTTCFHDRDDLTGNKSSLKRQDLNSKKHKQKQLQLPELPSVVQ